jgi:hypothetical protein
MSDRKKPPPDTRENLEGRRQHLIRQAWAAATGGLHVIMAGAKSTEPKKTYPEMEVDFKKTLTSWKAKFEAISERERKLGISSEVRLPPPPRPKEEATGSDFLDFAMSD